MPSEADMRKKGRGSFIERVTILDDVEVCLVAWYDNKLVTTISTYVGSQPASEVQRFCRKTKTYINIPRPQCIGVYKNYMC